MTSPPASQPGSAALSRQAGSPLLADFSLGVTGKDVSGPNQVRALIPAGTRIYVGFVDSDDMAARVAMADWAAGMRRPPALGSV